MTSFDTIIDALGIGRLAILFGVRESHVRVMKARNSIPPEYWGVLIDEASKQGHALDFAGLRSLRAGRFRPSDATPTDSTSPDGGSPSHVNPDSSEHDEAHVAGSADPALTEPASAEHILNATAALDQHQERRIEGATDRAEGAEAKLRAVQRITDGDGASDAGEVA